MLKNNNFAVKVYSAVSFGGSVGGGGGVDSVDSSRAIKISIKFDSTFVPLHFIVIKALHVPLMRVLQNKIW